MGASLSVPQQHFAGSATRHIDSARVDLLNRMYETVPVDELPNSTRSLTGTTALEGVKLRTPSRDQAEIIKGLGAIPVALPMPATYQAIEKGGVDGSLVGISVVRSFKLAEVVKNYIIDLPMGYSPQMIVMNKKVYAGLSAAQKKAIDDNRGLTWSLRAAKLYENARKGGLKLVKSRKDTNITKLTAAEKKLWDDRIGKIAEDWVIRFEKAGFKDYRKMLADYMSK